eukprot:gene1375-801_t
MEALLATRIPHRAHTSCTFSPPVLQRNETIVRSLTHVHTYRLLFRTFHLFDYL